MFEKNTTAFNLNDLERAMSYCNCSCGCDCDPAELGYNSRAAGHKQSSDGGLKNPSPS